MLALRAFDARVATIGHRIAVASLDLCSQLQWRPGVALHHLSQYSGRSQAHLEGGKGQVSKVIKVQMRTSPLEK